MISKSSNIARRAKRVVDVAEAEMENSLDPDYVAKMAAAKDNLGQCKCFLNTIQFKIKKRRLASYSVYRFATRGFFQDACTKFLARQDYCKVW